MTYEYKGKTPKPLRVYGWIGFRHVANDLLPNPGKTNRPQTREIIAAKNVSEVLKATGMSRYAFNQCGAETGNAEELQQARSKPGVIFWRPLDSLREDIPWQEAEPEA